jgi:hypothetical protein
MPYDLHCGNDTFFRVRDPAGPSSSITTGRVTTPYVTASRVNASTVNSSSFAVTPSGKTLVEVELRTHSSWSGSVSTVTALTTNGSNIYRVPIGGINLVSATLIGASDLWADPTTEVNVGSNSTVASANNIFGSADGDDFEYGGSISVGKDFSNFAFGSTGSPAGLVLNYNDYITLQTQTASFHDVGGGARLRLVYYV